MQSLAGHWANIDAGTNGMIGYSVATKGSALRLACYGKCCPSWSVSVFDATVTQTGFSCSADYGFKKEETTGTMQPDGTLKVDESTVYTDDSGRSARSSEYILHQVAGGLAEMEAHLTATFYGGGGGFRKGQIEGELAEFDTKGQAVFLPN